MARRLIVVGIIAVLATMVFIFLKGKVRDDFAELPPLRQSDDYERLDVIAHLDVPVTNDRTVVYCGSFQLAWNELNRRAGTPVAIEGTLDDALNASKLSLADVSAMDVTTIAGSDVATFERANAEMQRFGVEPLEVNVPVQDRLVIVAALRDTLKFRFRFNKLSSGIQFKNGTKTSDVSAFGIGKRTGDHDVSDFDGQVLLRNHLSSDDFIITLTGKDSDTELILAKVPPGDSMQSMVTAVLGRIDSEKRGTIGRLAIPQLQLNVARKYSELLNKPIQNGRFKGWQLVDAVQVTQFQLNRSGAKVASSSRVAPTKDGPGWKLPTRPDLTFDKPFLVIMRHKSRPQPYFVMWVATADVMVAK